MHLSKSVGRHLVMMLALAFGLMAALPLSGLAQGNSENAHLCQQGGWQFAVRADTGAGFLNQGDCVSYGAQGGEIVVLTGIVIPAGHSATISGFFSACNILGAYYTTTAGEFVSLGSSSGCTPSHPFAPVTTPVYERPVVLTFTLEDLSYEWEFKSDGDHALVTMIPGGYQVDIMDSGDGWDTGERYPEFAGGGNLSVQVIIN